MIRAVPLRILLAREINIAENKPGAHQNPIRSNGGDCAAHAPFGAFEGLGFFEVPAADVRARSVPAPPRLRRASALGMAALPCFATCPGEARDVAVYHVEAAHGQALQGVARH